jgi:HK97 family phage major capsid protein
MNRFTRAALHKLKNASGHDLWQLSLTAGQRATLLGYSVSECDARPDMAPDALPSPSAISPLARGNRAGIRTLRNPFCAKPCVMLYATERVGGGV